jgi:protein-S-isoprenylcysteine O-methyltransferase Ste14
MQFWNPTETSPATMLVFMLGGAVFIAAVLFKQLGQAKAMEGAGLAPARRDPASLLGVVLQMIGIALASGPVRIVGSEWLDGLDSPRTWLTALTVFGAAGLFFWAARTMGANWSIVARLRPGHELVTSGPFALVRHPIYLAMLLFLLAVAFATAHEQALVLAVPLFIVGTLIRTSREEALLRTEFGAAYEAYPMRVKRFIPGIL